MKEKTAIIITGNPALIKNNPRAEKFYKALQEFLEGLDYRVKLDPGKPFTAPKPADIWIGHSRGADRLRFAPKGTKAIGIGVPESTADTPFPVVNHPNDAMIKRTFHEGKIIKENRKSAVCDRNHYILTEEMKTAIAMIIEKEA